MTNPEAPQDIPEDPTVDPDIKPPPVKAAKKKSEPKPEPETRRLVGTLVEEEDEEEEVVLTLEEQRSFERALTIGRRTATVKLADCDITVQTLKGADEMRIGLYTKPYLETQGFARAYQIGVCAAGVVEIRGPHGDVQPLWESLKEIRDESEIFRKNCIALAEFRPIMTTKIYQAIQDLEREDAELGTKLGKY